MTGGSQQCAGPGCAAPLRQARTGRPVRYCGPACRQAARRERIRREQAAAMEAARLSAARAAAADLWPRVEHAAFDVGELGGLEDVGDLAADVVTAVMSGPGGRAGLMTVLGQLHRAAADFAARVGELERLALAYRAAAIEAGELDVRPVP